MSEPEQSRHRKRRPRRWIRVALAVALGLGTLGVASIARTAFAAADGCYTWSGTLREGAKGEPVRQLQIRVAGWMTNDDVLTIDGEYGPRTTAAVKRFQAGYNLGADGVAGPQTFAKIYELQDDDCTPIHFTYSELDQCNANNSYSGSSKASPAEAKARALKVMWQLEAVRRKLGDDPLRVTSGFRSDRCNQAAGGASNSAHLYGASADLGAGPHSLCTIYRAARSSGFSGLLGPGYPDHNDHVHADSRHLYGGSEFRSAPSC